MNKGVNTGELLLRELEKRYTVRREDVGADARLSKSGMAFETESYVVEGLGHYCIMRMKAMLGLMKMETAVLSPVGKDLPLFNLDWVKAMGKETQIVEIYDTQLQPLATSAIDAFEQIRGRDRDLEDYSSGKAHWYDAILYPCSYHKTGKGVSARLARAAGDYVQAYLKLTEDAPDCDVAAKEEKARAFAETLFEQGGPAVDQVTRLFGRDCAKRLILRWMYGVGEKEN